MALNMKAVLVMGLAILSFVSVAHAFTGTATYYTVYTPSACYGYANKGNYVAALSDSLYNNGKICGRKIRCKCTGGTNSVPNPCKSGTVDVTAVDRCPSPGCASTIDLSKEAFNVIANPEAGKVKISCDILPGSPSFCKRIVKRNMI